MSLPHMGLSIQCLGQVEKCDKISSDLQALDCTIVNLSLGPMIYEEHSLVRQPPNNVQGMIWVLPRVCLRIVKYSSRWWEEPPSPSYWPFWLCCHESSQRHPSCCLRDRIFFLPCIVVRINTPALQFFTPMVCKITLHSLDYSTGPVRLCIWYGLVARHPTCTSSIWWSLLSFVPQEIWMLIAPTFIPDLIKLSQWVVYLSSLGDAIKVSPNIVYHVRCRPRF